MRVAVTGASGFIGRALTLHLEQRGDAVLALRRERDGFASPIGAHPDALVHLAFATDAATRRADPEAATAQAERDVLAAFAIASAHVILASSGKAYAPATELGRIKLACEEVARAAARSSRKRLTILRIFNVYGPGQPQGFLFPTLAAGLASGRLVLGELDHARDWIHVRDVASAVAAALATPPEREPRVLDVGTGRATTVREILRMIGVPPPETAVDPARTTEPSSERAAIEPLRALGWAPRVTLEEGVAELFGAQPRGGP